MIALLKNILIFLVLIFGKKFCEAENCDKFGLLFYEDIACKPVKTENKCPSEYECNISPPKSGCLFKGKNYGSGDEIATPVSSCSIACRCADLNTITCAEFDCPEFFGYNKKPGCYNGYELNKCCSSGQICNSTQTKKCEVDGSSYELGQRFYPKNTCYSCVCHDHFTGKYDEKTCIRQTCNAQIYFTSEVSQNCAPAYFRYNSDEVLCCPDDFICADISDKTEVVNSNVDKESNLECSYGEKKFKLGEGFKRTIKNGQDRHMQCECVVPPFLTCKEI